jgi:hypothetical protein
MQDFTGQYTTVSKETAAINPGFTFSNFAGILEMPSPSHSMLKDEGGENFYEYLDWLGLADDNKILVLPLSQHFYYDHEDLKDVKTLINLRRLNRTKNLNGFLYTLSTMLTKDTSLIGCFRDWKSARYSGIPSMMYKGIVNLIDAKTDTRLESEQVSELLGKHGFRVVDMTEFSDITYFRAVSI